MGFGIRKQLKASIPCDHARAGRDRRVSPHRRVVCELECERSVGIGLTVEQPGDAKMHELTAGLGDLRVYDLVNQRMVEGVHAGGRSRALEEGMALELAERVHQRVERE
jgi:hypothetical protein